jgi:PhzF family phenazine biosynthesis protein
MIVEQDTDAWHVQVFDAEDAAGNATGIIFVDERCIGNLQSLATRLAFPDTGFVARTDPRVWRIRAYSPVEELSFCGQTVLALGAVLRAMRGQPSCGRVLVHTAAGPVELSEDDGGDSGRFWVRLTIDHIGGRRNPNAVAGLLQIDSNWLGPEIVIGFGRHRAYVEVGEIGHLHVFTPDPGEVMRYCREHGISAVCPFVRVGVGHLALRVFTTSLSGREDAATCGAVAALPAYLATAETAAGAGEWRVDQGSGGVIGRGRLYLRSTEGPRSVAVGGHTRILTVGNLQKSAWT